MSKMKETLLTKHKKEVPEKQSETLPATQYKNPWLEAAAEGGNELGRILKFRHDEVKWKVGESVVADGTEYVAHIDQLVKAYVKFEDNKVVDRVVGKVADGFQAAAARRARRHGSEEVDRKRR